MIGLHQEFLHRARQVTAHGLGLSVDVYQPDLFDLLASLEREAVACDYLEIFRAAQPAAEAVRSRLAGCPLECHAEGLWVTQPDWLESYPAETEIAAVAGQLRALGSQWVTHECAAKQMAGFSFGTYLPPLFTAAGAEATAANSLVLQERLDARAGKAAPKPLLLLEMPPLTFFACGDLTVPAFFRRLADRSSCGLVLDIGHLWTVWRYAGSGAARSLTDFAAEFLDLFPMERVIQIHVAGLALHETMAEDPGSPPWWIDAHGAAIPAVLFDLLEQVLAHPGLTNLKGLALEVDTKAVPLIVEELRAFRRRCAARFHDPAAPWNREATDAGPPARPALLPDALSPAAALRSDYARYARMACGQSAAPLPLSDARGLRLYQQQYLPHEILHWGGDLRELFPAACRELDGAGVALADFVAFWSQAPRKTAEPYDFFLLKLDRFVDFAAAAAPAVGRTAAREAEALRAAYRAACDLETPA